MNRSMTMALVFAALMIGFAVLARLGLADRDTVQILLIVLPIIAVTSFFRNRSRPCCDDAAAEA